MLVRRSGDQANSGARPGSFSDRADVTGLVAFTLDLAFGSVEFLAATAIDPAHTRAKIACHSIGQCQYVETQVQLAAALHAARTLDLGYGAGDPASRRNYDAAVVQDREHSLQVHAVALRGILGAYGVDQAKR